MAKTTAPLLSFGGSGAIAKTQVYASWRGVKYARRYVVPSNPRSNEQTSTRSVFGWLNAVWKVLNSNGQAPWFLFAKGRPFTDRNAFIAQNLANLRGTTLVPVVDITDLKLSPGANAGLAAVSLVLADATGHHITATLAAPDLPDGWAIVKEHAFGFMQQDAHIDQDYTSVYAFDATDPYAADLNMGAAGDYVVSAFFEYTKPDGSTAFSPSITHAITIA